MGSRSRRHRFGFLIVPARIKSTVRHPNGGLFEIGQYLFDTEQIPHQRDERSRLACPFCGGPLSLRSTKGRVARIVDQLSRADATDLRIIELLSPKPGEQCVIVQIIPETHDVIKCQPCNVVFTTPKAV